MLGVPDFKKKPVKVDEVKVAEVKVAEKTKSFSLKAEDGGVSLVLDSDKDGEPSLTLDLNIIEAFAEILGAGQKAESGAKFTLKMVGTSLVIGVDTDGDGKNVLTLKVHSQEILSEVLKKRK